ncbi:MAG: hypothetical protein WB502_07135 [Thermoactinomyces sp.]
MQQQIHELLRDGSQKEYKFALKISTDKNSVRYYQGKQDGENWVISDTSGKKVMERKDKKVWAYHSGNKEEMTVNQAGLVSPKDHLLFLQKVLGKVEFIRKMESPVQKKARVTVDPHKFSEQFRKRLNINSNTSPLPVYKDYHIYYELIYLESPNKQLKQIILNMPEQGEASHSLIYTLEI